MSDEIESIQHKYLAESKSVIAEMVQGKADPFKAREHLIRLASEMHHEAYQAWLRSERGR